MLTLFAFREWYSIIQQEKIYTYIDTPTDTHIFSVLLIHRILYAHTYMIHTILYTYIIYTIFLMNYPDLNV